MAKTCKHPECNNPAWGGGYCGFPSHQALRTDSSYLRSQARKLEKKRSATPIRTFSVKYSKEIGKYNRRAPIYKAENPICKFPGCCADTCDIHHKKGRGKYLNDESTWLPMCRSHHEWAELNPQAARQIGVSVSRLV